MSRQKCVRGFRGRRAALRLHAFLPVLRRYTFSSSGRSRHVRPRQPLALALVSSRVLEFVPTVDVTISLHMQLHGLSRRAVQQQLSRAYYARC